MLRNIIIHAAYNHGNENCCGNIDKWKMHGNEPTEITKIY